MLAALSCVNTQYNHTNSEACVESHPILRLELGVQRRAHNLSPDAGRRREVSPARTATYSRNWQSLSSHVGIPCLLHANISHRRPGSSSLRTHLRHLRRELDTVLLNFICNSSAWGQAFMRSAGGCSAIHLMNNRSRALNTQTAASMTTAGSDHSAASLLARGAAKQAEKEIGAAR